MLTYLVGWIILVFLGGLIGSGVLAIAKSSFLCHAGDRLIAATWLGLLIIATSLLGLSIVLPLSPATGLCVSVMLAVIALTVKGVRDDLKRLLDKPQRSILIGVTILGVMSALNSTRFVDVYDTGLYHYQLTRWLRQYGTVPGLALIHSRFGFSSSWFALAAPFDFGPFQARIGGLLGGLALFLALSHFAVALARIIEHREDEADWLLVGGYPFIFLVCLSWSFEVSLSPDLPVWILTLLTAWLMVLAGTSKESRDSALQSGRRCVLPLMMAFGTITIKLTAVPVAAVAALFFLFSSPLKWPTRLAYVFFASLIAFPVLAANLTSSGCPFYPNALLCVDVPWGVGKAAAHAEAAGIGSWARWGASTPAGARAWDWVWPWMHHTDKFIISASCATCLLGFVAVRGWRKGAGLRWVLGLALAGTAFVFGTAPNPRFGAGYLAIFPALLLAAVGPEVRDTFGLRPINQANVPKQICVGYILGCVAVILALQDGAAETRFRRKLDRSEQFLQGERSLSFARGLLPPALPRFSEDLMIVKNRRRDNIVSLKLATARLNDIEYQRPIYGDQCWGATLPCLPTQLAGAVHFRRPDVGPRSGFIRPPDVPTGDPR